MSDTPQTFAEAIELLVDLEADATLDYLLLEAYIICHDCLKPLLVCPHGRERRFWVLRPGAEVRILE